MRLKDFITFIVLPQGMIVFFLFSCRFLERDPDDAELEVDFFPGENVARVRFYNTLKHREPPLCRLHLKTPSRGTDYSVSHSRVFLVIKHLVYKVILS